MVNSLLDAVTTQLGKTFGTSYRYYVENVEQGLTTPCFTIDLLDLSERAKSPVLYDRTMPIVIHYFSGSKSNIKRDCYSKAETILECLEYIPFQNTILRGENMTWRVVDDVLQVHVTYKFTARMSRGTEENMESILDTIVRAN